MFTLGMLRQHVIIRKPLAIKPECILSIQERPVMGPRMKLNRNDLERHE